jgi:predicted ATPase|tara:strand:- start:305 stop:571 length:267 start_codon:yes stop_codon:yes gene_type:complete
MKKYHQSAEDRKHESEGMKRERSENGYFHMLKEDRSAPANLPQHVIHETYPKNRYLDAYELDDTMRGLDDTRSEDVRNMERYHSDVKY